MYHFEWCFLSTIHLNQALDIHDAEAMDSGPCSLFFFTFLYRHVYFLYEHLSSTSSEVELWEFHNGNYSTILCFWADPLCSSCTQLWRSDCSFTVTQCVLNVHWSGYSAVYLFNGWCYVKLLPSWCMFCGHHTTRHQFTVSFYSKPQMKGACVFSCSLPPALLAEWLGSFTCYCRNMGWNGYWNKSQHRKLTLEKKILLPLLLGLEPETFWSQAAPTDIYLSIYIL